MSSTPTAVNSAGDVVGSSGASDGGYHAFFWSHGVMTDLGTLGGHYSAARAVNDHSQVVGVASEAGDLDYHAVLWQSGTTTDLGTLTSGGSSEAVAINDAGQVIGWSNGSVLHRAFLWQNGTMTDFTPQGDYTEATAINDHGLVVGSWWGGDRAFLWDGSTMTDLGTMGYGPNKAIAINNVGQVVGWSYTAYTAGNHRRAFLWQNGTLTDLGSLGGCCSSAVAVNDSGQVVGWSNTEGDTVRHAVLWTLRPATPAEELLSLTNTVNTLRANRVLSFPNAQPLLNMLANAAQQLTKAHYAEAANVLQYGFIPKVQNNVRKGILLASDGQTLIDAAQNAISTSSAPCPS